MPSLWTHCAISKKRTGKDYKELHKWIDGAKGIDHRQVNHFYTTKLKNIVSENFDGAEAVGEWLFHVALDNLATSIKNDKKNLKKKDNLFKFGFEDNGFIHFEQQKLESDKLQKEFNDGYDPNHYEKINQELIQEMKDAGVWEAHMDFWDE